MEYLRYDIGSISNLNININDGVLVLENNCFFNVSNHMTAGELEVLKDIMWCPDHYDILLTMHNKEDYSLLKNIEWTICRVCFTYPIPEIVIDVVGTRDQLLLFKLSMPLSPISHGVV